ncbi:MAG: preprotein translocase subunit SecE, partial [Candidatus Gastranaerophilaceae bacterium]
MSRVRVLQGAIYIIKKGKIIMMGTEENALQTWFANTLNGIKTYFRGVRTEWGKISWPERRQVIAETVFVIIIVFVFT